MKPDRYYLLINSLLDDWILALSTLKAFADDNFNVAQMVQLIFDWLENILEKDNMSDTSIFSNSHFVFQMLL